MKRGLLLAVIIAVFVVQAYGQNDRIAEFIDRCIAKLDGAVPDGFRRFDRTLFINDEDIFIAVENGIVILSGFGGTYSTTHEAHADLGVFFDYFEDSRNNWDFLRTTFDGSNIYSRNGVFAHISRPTRRDDGLIVFTIGFSRNINNF